MIPSTATVNAFRQSAIRFLACIAALSAAGLALVITNPSWWPVSLVTVGTIPFLYHFAGPRRLVHGAVGATGVLEHLEARGYGVWHRVCVGDRVICHVVVGPTGVFVVTRIGWSGRFRMGQDGWVRHSRKDASRLVWEASRDAAAVKGRLRAAGLRTVPVRAVVALTRARISQDWIDLGQATVMRVSQVPKYVLSSSGSLSPEQVARAMAAFGGEEPTQRSRPGRS
jgi:nuclease-like protein